MMIIIMNPNKETSGIEFQKNCKETCEGDMYGRIIRLNILQKPLAYSLITVLKPLTRFKEKPNILLNRCILGSTHNF